MPTDPAGIRVSVNSVLQYKKIHKKNNYTHIKSLTNNLEIGGDNYEFI